MTGDQLIKVNKSVSAIGIENIKKIIIIENKATCGDIIEAIFPHADIRRQANKDYKITSELAGYALFFDSEWWNSEYEEVEE